MKQGARRGLLSKCLATSLVLVCVHCSGNTSTVGTETHWVKPCQTSEDCGDLSCVCGVCSLPCVGVNDCVGNLEVGECAAPQSAPDPSRCQPEVVGFCRPTLSNEPQDTKSGMESGGSSSNGGVGSGGVVGSGGGSQTTAATAAFPEEDSLNAALLYNCSSSLCHGTPDQQMPPTSTPLDLFIPDRNTAWLDEPGFDCPDENLIDTRNPSRSLMLTTIYHTAECGVEMPGFPMSADDTALIETWVHWLAEQGQ